MAIVIDALSEAAISNLFQSVTSLLKDKVDLIRNAKVELEKIQEKLERLQKTIKVIERKPFFSNERNRDLEGELKGVVYDAQDIIEEYQTRIALCKRDKHPITSWNKVKAGLGKQLLQKWFLMKLKNSLGMLVVGLCFGEAKSYGFAEKDIKGSLQGIRRT
ncbi:uncharacterized protein LOC116245173 [Nymphaea colorata]|nr:uncharacterized protein LOC116245173 [Nymphaea colorata]